MSSTKEYRYEVIKVKYVLFAFHTALVLSFAWEITRSWSRITFLRLKKFYRQLYADFLKHFHSFQPILFGVVIDYFHHVSLFFPYFLHSHSYSFTTLSCVDNQVVGITVRQISWFVFITSQLICRPLSNIDRLVIVAAACGL